MKVTATFVGSNLSMGFIKGQTYTLDVRGNTIYTGTKSCPYNSLEAFLRNWTDIEVVS